MKIVMGEGKVKVSTYGDGEGNYGLALRVDAIAHEIGEADSKDIGMKVEDWKPDLEIDFYKSASVQVVIDKLIIIRDDLIAREGK